MDAFDADVLIYAVVAGHPLGDRVRALLDGSEPGSCIGSVLVVPEILIKPGRLGLARELDDLKSVLALLVLHEVECRTANLAVDLGVRYRLKTVDAVHLATAVLAGADRFLTNNTRDFTPSIVEIDVLFPADLPAP